MQTPQTRPDDLFKISPSLFLINWHLYYPDDNGEGEVLAGPVWMRLERQLPTSTGGGVSIGLFGKFQ